MPRIARLVPCAFSIALLLPAGVRAQAVDAEAVHWAYSTWFGTGWYRIGDTRDAFAVRYAPRRLVREQSIAGGERHYGLEVRVPVTVGLEHFPLDDLPGSVDPENFASVSVTPEVHVQVPVSERWTLRPFAALGWGTVLNGDESAWTWWAGLRSRYRMDAGRLGWSWLYSVAVVGHSPSEGPSSNFWPVMTAFEFDYPFGAREWQGEALFVNWHVAYTWFADELELFGPDRRFEQIRDQWQLGIGIHKADSPISMWRLRFDRLTLVYRVSSDGELRGIGLDFRSLFDL
ncbi:MAG TPA: hypothetical protein VKZ85_11710 [Woeseiaceae bacterium]|nr:hypothetical protein [Woeseiaceae bacterium]